MPTTKCVRRFEKVSFEQFKKDLWELMPKERPEFIRNIYDDIQLPRRATSGSAGYDFHSPISFELRPGDSVKIPTGIRVKIDDGCFLACFPRSGLGFKYRLQLDNTVGIIDSDYYDSDNEGHIFAKVTNDGHDGKVVSIDAGDAFMQGIFIRYGLTYDDDTTAIRNGGIGSTDKQ